MADTVAIAGITAAAGFGGAVVAAVAAEFRQRNALAHDREMRDLSEVRNRLDDVMDQGEKALADMIRADESRDEESHDRCEEHLQAAGEKLIKVQARIRRVRLLYGDDYGEDEDIVIPLQTYLGNLEAVHKLLESEQEKSGERDQEEFTRIVSAAGVSQREVIVIASRLIGARVQR